MCGTRWPMTAPGYSSNRSPGDTPEDAHNSVGRVFLAGSTILCTPRPSLTTGPHALGN